MAKVNPPSAARSIAPALVFAGLDRLFAGCHTYCMTARGRLNARLDPELERKLSYLCRRTGLAVSDVVRASIERYYEAVCAEGADARAILEETGFIASGTGPKDLSERYKEHLAESLAVKQP